MNRILILLTVLVLLFSLAAAGTYQPGDPDPTQLATDTTRTGPAWLGILILVVAGGIYIYVRSLQPPGTVNTNCCAPLIDEAKETEIEARRQSLAPEEKS